MPTKSELRSQTVCFTGHRDIPLMERYRVKKRLRAVLVELIEKGYCYFGAGGALGFDTMAALTVLELKKKYKHIKLVMVLPCRNQTNKWKPKNVRIYEDILRRADKEVCLSEHYTSGCMHVRNRHLVDNSALCICYLTKDSGGTAYTVEYARRCGVEVINLKK